MKSLWAALAVLALACGSAAPSFAQAVSGAVVVATCGTPPVTYTAGSAKGITQDTTGTLCTAGGGGGGGGAVTVADGADVTQGALADAACATDNGTCTIEALIKRNNQRLTTLLAGIPVTQSGTWTVQPGNTANTTAWKVDGSAVTQPISGTVTVTDGAGALNVIVDSSALPSGAATSANQATEISSLASIVTNTSTPTGVAQGSTTSGQLGSMSQCATTTAAPTYTTAKTNPCSADVNGGQRTLIQDSSGVAVSYTSTVPTGTVDPYPGTNVAGVFTASTPETCTSGVIANATATCTLAASASKTTYLRWFMVTSDGATATSSVSCTITGSITATLQFTYTYEAATIPTAPLIVPAGDLPASTTNTTIVISCPASGAGGSKTTISALGFQR